MDTKYIKAQTKVKDDGTIQMVVFSDGSVDRAGDTIDPNGWELKDFNKNPVLLWAHDSGFDKSIPAIGNVKNLKVNNSGQLVGSLEFDMDDPFAVKVYKKYKKGILKATSVGFMPLEAEENNEKGIDFKKQQLLEISCVNVPANANALTVMRGMKGKEAKAQRKLMKEFLKNHAPDKEEKQDEPDPMAERLENVITEFENATNSLKQIVSQLETRITNIPVKKEQKENTVPVDIFNDLVDAVRMADKANELFLKKANRIKRERGGEK